MAKYTVNDEGVEKARSLIDAGQYVLDSDWGDAQPSADEGNDKLERDGYEGYGQWFLAKDTDASDETKDRYGFPYGDFERVHRSGLVAAQQRAAQNEHSEVAPAARELLERLDEKSTS